MLLLLAIVAVAIVAARLVFNGSSTVEQASGIEVSTADSRKLNSDSLNGDSTIVDPVHKKRAKAGKRATHSDRLKRKPNFSPASPLDKPIKEM